MEHTSNYNLSQWAGEDRILREDFNADNAKIEAALANAGNCKIAAGSYTGTGTSGSWAKSNSLTFAFVPKLVIIKDNSTYQQVGVFIWNCNATVHSSNSTYTAVFYMTGSGVPMVKYEGNSMSWFSNNNAVKQMNDNGKTYRWIAIG
jgi:hypothetical protein